MNLSQAISAEQLRATRALLKFCEEHGYKSSWLVNIHDCASALEKGDLSAAFANYSAVPLGGNGCFNDWWPPIVYPHETEEYNWTVFESLVCNWSILMRVILKEIR
jgi:hypothetical protein